MTNSIAIVLALVILAVVAVNFLAGWELHLFLGRILLGAVEWLAFWR